MNEETPMIRSTTAKIMNISHEKNFGFAM